VRHQYPTAAGNSRAPPRINRSGPRAIISRHESFDACRRTKKDPKAMSRVKKLLKRNVWGPALVGLALSATFVTAAAAQQPATGGVRGRVRVGAGTPAGINVTVRQGEREVRETRTNSKGEFEIAGLAPGAYGLTFRKPGVQVGRMNVEVKAGKVLSLPKDKLFLPVDEGAIAFIRGSVFNGAGRGFAGVKVELELLGADGKARKLDERVTNSLGQFAFRMTPEPARYRVTAKADGMEPAAAEVAVDSAAIFRVGLTLERRK
jgi:hypothetical protein